MFNAVLISSLNYVHNFVVERTLIEIFHKQTMFDNKWGKNEYDSRSMLYDSLGVIM